jgi:hypothetical protein
MFLFTAQICNDLLVGYGNVDDNHQDLCSEDKHCQFVGTSQESVNKNITA